MPRLASIDPDARSDHGLPYLETIVPYLKRQTWRWSHPARCGSSASRPAPGKAGSARTSVAAETRRSAASPAAGPRLMAISSSPEIGSSARRRHAARLASDLAGDVQAEIPAVDRVDIGMARQAEQHQIARCRAAMRVSRGIGRGLVRPEIGLHLHNPADHLRAAVPPSDQQLPQKPRSDPLRPRFKELARHQPPRHLHFLCAFPSSISASTCSACPSGVTLGKM